MAHYSLATSTAQPEKHLSEKTLIELGLDGIPGPELPEELSYLCEYVELLDFVVRDDDPAAVLDYIPARSLNEWREWDGTVSLGYES